MVAVDKTLAAKKIKVSTETIDPFFFYLLFLSAFIIVKGL